MGVIVAAARCFRPAEGHSPSLWLLHFVAVWQLGTATTVVCSSRSRACVLRNADIHGRLRTALVRDVQDGRVGHPGARIGPLAVLRSVRENRGAIRLDHLSVRTDQVGTTLIARRVHEKSGVLPRAVTATCPREAVGSSGVPSSGRLRNNVDGLERYGAAAQSFDVCYMPWCASYANFGLRLAAGWAFGRLVGHRDAGRRCARRAGRWDARRGGRLWGCRRGLSVPVSVPCGAACRLGERLSVGSPTRSSLLVQNHGQAGTNNSCHRSHGQRRLPRELRRSGGRFVADDGDVLQRVPVVEGQHFIRARRSLRCRRCTHGPP